VFEKVLVEKIVGEDCLEDICVWVGDIKRINKMYLFEIGC